ncbi:SusC/RagA family TonB-linked outer membrane protein [Bacteroidota bacterium]
MLGFIDLNANTRSSYGIWSEPVGYLSAFGRITYDYLSKYMFTANFRRDGATKFGKDKKFGNFPSISVGWNIANENFMKGTEEIVNDIKLRVGYGYVGNSSISDNQYVSTLATTAYSFNNKSTPGYYPASIANPDLHWEASKQINLGFDVSLFDHVLLFTADYYAKNTKDMLVEIPLAGYLGIDQNYTVNEGEMKNTGYEFDLTIHNSFREFSYEFNSFISFLKNEVTNIAKGERYLDYDYTRTQVGFPVGAFYGWKTDGIFQTQKEIDELNKREQKYDSEGDPLYDAQGNPIYVYTYYQDKETGPGDIRFKDIASINEEGEIVSIPDGIVDEADRTIIGDPIPDLTFGIATSLYYKNFNLDIICDGIYGNELINVPRINSESMTLSSNFSKFVYDNYWKGPGSGNEVPRPIESDPNDNARISDRWIEDGSYFRITNIQFGYQLPYRIINRLKIYRFKIYISVKNLYTFSNYSGYDPDIGAYQRNALQAGIDYGSYPKAKSVFLGFNIDF